MIEELPEVEIVDKPKKKPGRPAKPKSAASVKTEDTEDAEVFMYSMCKYYRSFFFDFVLLRSLFCAMLVTKPGCPAKAKIAVKTENAEVRAWPFY